MSCQIALVYEDQVGAVTVDQKESFTALTNKVATVIDFDNTVTVDKVYFVYEDDDGDVVVVDNDADLAEAVAVHQDAGIDELMFIVKIKDSHSKQDKEEEDKQEEPVAVSPPAKPSFKEHFVLDVSKFLADDFIRNMIPQVCAEISAMILRKESADSMVQIITSRYPLIAESEFFNKYHNLTELLKNQFDNWVGKLTDDQLGKVAFQIPLIAAKLVAKRKKLHHALIEKQKPLGAFLKMPSFEFGEVDLVPLIEKLEENGGLSVADDTGAHAGSSCAVCFTSPIEKVRYRCMVCVNFDMCERCESKGEHPADHALMKFRNPTASYVGHYGGYDKKALKHQLKTIKLQTKIAKMELKKEGKSGKKQDKLLKKQDKLAEKLDKHEKYGHSKHGTTSSKTVLPPSYEYHSDKDSKKTDDNKRLY